MAEKEPTNTQGKNSDEIIAEIEKAKKDLMEAAEAIDPLKSIRSHPLIGLTGAFIGGICLGRLNNSLKAVSVLPLALQAGELILKLAASNKQLMRL